MNASHGIAALAAAIALLATTGAVAQVTKADVVEHFSSGGDGQALRNRIDAEGLAFDVTGTTAVEFLRAGVDQAFIQWLAQEHTPAPSEVEDGSTSVADPPAPRGPPLPLSSVVRMVQEGESDDAIRQVIRDSQSVYAIDKRRRDALLSLGLSADLVDYLAETPQLFPEGVIAPDKAPPKESVLREIAREQRRRELKRPTTFFTIGMRAGLAGSWAVEGLSATVGDVDAALGVTLQVDHRFDWFGLGARLGYQKLDATQSESADYFDVGAIIRLNATVGEPVSRHHELYLGLPVGYTHMSAGSGDGLNAGALFGYRASSLASGFTWFVEAGWEMHHYPSTNIAFDDGPSDDSAQSPPLPASTLNEFVLRIGLGVAL